MSFNVRNKPTLFEKRKQLFGNIYSELKISVPPIPVFNSIWLCVCSFIVVSVVFVLLYCYCTVIVRLLYCYCTVIVLLLYCYCTVIVLLFDLYYYVSLPFIILLILDSACSSYASVAEPGKTNHVTEPETVTTLYSNGILQKSPNISYFYMLLNTQNVFGKR